ncbi:MAG: long-chain fatty acid--CoA ligase [Verrucomicrobiaceae bacterium]|nr:MAG: long-chain fatty acid--CoA ligase [Verrucomicrobiaceae bacterium]
MNNPILERWRRVVSGGDGPAIYGPSGEVSRTFTDIQAEAEELAGHLPAISGAVALQVGNHESFPALLLAIWRAGRTVCLFDAELQGNARADIERELGVTVRTRIENGRLEFEMTGSSGNLQSGVDLYKLTSGTASRPRPIGFTAAQLLADCDHICETMGIRADDLNFGVIAFSHSYGFSNLVTPLLCGGVRLVVAPDALPRAIEAGLVATGASVLPAVPALFRGLLSASALPETLRLCISAGAPLDPAVGKEFHARFGRKIHTFYGASECGAICYDGTEEIIGEPGFVGHPLAGVRVEMVEISPPSRIRIRSDAVGIEGGIFEPADLLMRDGRGFWIVGRESDQINVAGKKVNPGEIERVIAGAPGVREVVVCGVEDPARGHEICALVAGEGDASELRRHCQALLVPWKIPRRFAFVSEIPTNARGKVSRKEVSRMFFAP